MYNVVIVVLCCACSAFNLSAWVVSYDQVLIVFAGFSPPALTLDRLVLRQQKPSTSSRSLSSFLTASMVKCPARSKVYKAFPVSVSSGPRPFFVSSLFK